MNIRFYHSPFCLIVISTYKAVESKQRIIDNEDNIVSAPDELDSANVRFTVGCEYVDGLITSTEKKYKFFNHSNSAEGNNLGTLNIILMGTLDKIRTPAQCLTINERSRCLDLWTKER